MTDLARIKVLLDQRSDADYDSLRHIDRELGQMVPGLLAEVARLEGESRQRSKERNDADTAYHDVREQRDRAMAALRALPERLNNLADAESDPRCGALRWAAKIAEEAIRDAESAPGQEQEKTEGRT